MINDLSIKIYCSYHSDDIFKTYKLNDINEKIIPFDLRINDMHHYINESFCNYYIYKNNIKSDIVGFCHYRRHFNLSNINFNDIINNNKIICCTIFGSFYFSSFKDLFEQCDTLSHKLKDKKNGFIEFLRENNIILQHNYDYYKHHDFRASVCNMYIARYDTFFYIENIMYKFMKKYIGDFENDSDLIKNVSKYDRDISYILEKIRGFFICNIKYNNSIIEYNAFNRIYLYNIYKGENINFNDINDLYYASIKRGSLNKFCIILNDIDEIQKQKIETYYKEKSFPIEFHMSKNNIFEHSILSNEYIILK